MSIATATWRNPRHNCNGNRSVPLLISVKFCNGGRGKFHFPAGKTSVLTPDGATKRSLADPDWRRWGEGSRWRKIRAADLVYQPKAARLEPLDTLIYT